MEKNTTEESAEKKDPDDVLFKRLVEKELAKRMKDSCPLCQGECVHGLR